MQCNRSGSAFHALGPANEKARSPSPKQFAILAWRNEQLMLTEDLSDWNDLQRVAQFHWCMTDSDQCGWDTSANTAWIESLLQLEANAADVNRSRCYHEDADSAPYVQQRSGHAEESQSLISVDQPVCCCSSRVWTGWRQMPVVSWHPVRHSDWLVANVGCGNNNCWQLCWRDVSTLVHYRIERQGHV